MSPFFQVLIVEDNAATSVMLQNTLTRLGCFVKLATSAESGLEELQKNAYHAVFAELCVKEQGGRFLARWVKSNSPATKFFVLTGWKGALEPRLLQSEGITDILHKPILFKNVRDKIIEHFG